MRMNLREIYFDEEIYPRGQMSQKTIDSYTEALKCGATFPPLKVQKVCYKNNGKEDIKTVCLDGKHRYRSYEEFNKSDETQERIKEIDVDEWRDEVLDYESDFISLLLQSAAFNKEHGDRISDTDCKKVARSVARADMVQAYSNDILPSKPD